MTLHLGRFLRQNAIALLALFIALGGTAFAATNVLPRNSVGTKQLQKNAVTSVKIKNNTVTGADVDEATLGIVPNARHATTADGVPPPEAYHEVGASGEPGFQHDWGNENPAAETTAAFYKDMFGVVRFKGMVSFGTKDTIFQLPPGYRPQKTLCLATMRNLDAASVCVWPTGEVFQSLGDTTGTLFLDGLTFNTGGRL